MSRTLVFPVILLDIFAKWEKLVKHLEGFMEIKSTGSALSNSKNPSFGYKCGYRMWDFKSMKDKDNIDWNYLKSLRPGKTSQALKHISS